MIFLAIISNFGLIYKPIFKSLWKLLLLNFLPNLYYLIKYAIFSDQSSIVGQKQLVRCGGSLPTFNKLFKATYLVN
ncbi:hypothetical protein CK516_11580 [Nostoc sp. 'Peltigera malacea cyanobiont' DB3992]|nr:hypothetical protein CK516_11580 [Nostoc sp. 'Peltigera malacea cyanobiont' DB3992]